MSELVAENQRFSQLAGHDHGGNTASNQVPCSNESASANGTGADEGHDSLGAHALTTDTNAMVRQMHVVIELMQETAAALNLARAGLDAKDYPPRRQRRPFGDKGVDSDDDDDDDDDEDDDDDDDGMGYRWQGTGVQRNGLDMSAGDVSAAEAAGLGATIQRGGTGSDGRLEKHHHQDDGSDSDDYWDVAEK